MASSPRNWTGQCVHPAPARREASARAADLILRLWERRASLPGNANPLASYRDALTALKTLSPDASPWQVRSGTRTQVLAAEIHGLVCRLVNLLLADAVPKKKRAPHVPHVAIKSLSRDERNLPQELDQRFASAVAKRDLPKLGLNLVDKIIGLRSELREQFSGSRSEDRANKETLSNDGQRSVPARATKVSSKLRKQKRRVLGARLRHL